MVLWARFGASNKSARSGNGGLKSTSFAEVTFGSASSGCRAVELLAFVEARGAEDAAGAAGTADAGATEGLAAAGVGRVSSAEWQPKMTARLESKQQLRNREFMDTDLSTNLACRSRFRAELAGNPSAAYDGPDD